MARALLRLMRPHQWIKNGFVFLGVVFGHAWNDPAMVAEVLLLFAAFCLASSAVYVMNDVADRNADRLHPKKQLRPIARGDVGVAAASAFGVALALAGAGLAARVSLPALAIVGAYVALNVAYSAGLKHVAILDVFIISAGFMLRILAGTMGLGIPPSKWLLLCGLTLTLFLGFGKRRAELLSVTATGDSDGASGHRASLDGYSRTLLDVLITVSVACSAIGYALYSVDAETVALHGTDKLILTLPFVLYGLFRYLQVMYVRGGGGDPAWDVLHDPHLIVTTLGWLSATAWILSG
ncbi:MAG TPA: decaprenyl-phosphate phosphoribosyltransferase [Burkholderiales bacterium]|nr:decaprenyl-phosphate phosphoribosyltransferase [Burkholderiales bacterium]